MARRYYCLDCTKVTDGDEDGFCTECGSDNTFSFTDEEVEQMIGLAPEPKP